MDGVKYPYYSAELELLRARDRDAEYIIASQNKKLAAAAESISNAIVAIEQLPAVSTDSQYQERVVHNWAAQALTQLRKVDLRCYSIYRFATEPAVTPVTPAQHLCKHCGTGTVGCDECAQCAKTLDEEMEREQERLLAPAPAPRNVDFTPKYREQRLAEISAHYLDWKDVETVHAKWSDVGFLLDEVRLLQADKARMEHMEKEYYSDYFPTLRAEIDDEMKGKGK